MCCRFVLETSPELRPYIEAANRSPLKEKMVDALAKPMVTSGEVRPTDIVPVIAPSSRSCEAAVFPMQWGFAFPGRQTSVFNARVETAAEKQAFRDSWQKRRCAIPASWYYEWEHIKNAAGQTKTGDRYSIQPKGCGVMFLAGLYRMEERGGVSLPVFTVLTREPGEGIRFIHDRMPVILPKEAVRPWVDPRSDPAEIVLGALTDMAWEKT